MRTDEKIDVTKLIVASSLGERSYVHCPYKQFEHLSISLDFENYKNADVRKETILKSVKVSMVPLVFKLLNCCLTVEIRTDLAIQCVCNVIIEWFMEITGKIIERMYDNWLPIVAWV